VAYTTNGSTAGSNTSCRSYETFVGVSGTLTFAPGETTKVVRVDINDCSLVVPLESFTFTLSNAVSGTISRATSTVEIYADGTSLSSIAVTPTNPSITAGASQQFTATGTFSDAETLNLTTFVD